MNQAPSIRESNASTMPGYDYGRSTAAHSPVSLEELREIEQTVGWTEEDVRILGQHADLFRNNAEPLVDAWRAVIGAKPFLAKWFFGPDGKPDDEYKAKVKKRFVQWVVDACVKPHDQAWLDYQEEIGLRHTPDKKNETDHVQSAQLVPLRFLIAFTTTVAITSRKVFVDAGIKGEELQKLQDAWAKAVQVHVTLWSRPYAKPALW